MQLSTSECNVKIYLDIIAITAVHCFRKLFINIILRSILIVLMMLEPASYYLFV